MIQDYDFDYEDDEEEEPDVDLENKYYNAKGIHTHRLLDRYDLTTVQLEKKTIPKRL